MTIDSLNSLSVVFFVCAAVFLIVGVVLFFVLDIISVYGDLSGRTAKKAIERMRKENEESGNKAYKPSPVNEKRGRLTDKISDSGRVISRQVGMAVNVGTQKFETGQLAPAETSNETTVLTNESANETTVLVNENTNETTILVNNEPVAQSVESATLTPSVELSFAGSAELIE